MCHSSVYSYHLLIFSASVMALHFLSFILPILAWNIPLISLIFLKRSLVYPITLLSSISLHCSLKKPFLPFLVILWNSAFKGIFFPFSMPSISLLFLITREASTDNHFAFLHFFFFDMVLVTASCIMLPTFVYSFSNILSTRSRSLNLSITSTV